MDSDVVLRCFAQGASLADLATLCQVPQGQLEQLLRESLTPRAEVAPARPLREGAPSKVNGQRTGGRLSKDEAESRVLVRLKPGPLTFTELSKETQMSDPTLSAALKRLLAAHTITKAGKQYQRA